MKYKAIVFDMDGTIIDTETIWQQATTDLLEARGVTFDKDIEAELEKKVKGLALHKSCLILKDMFKLDDEVEHLIKEQAHRANSRYHEGIKFIHGFEVFHHHATVIHGLKTALATNATDCTLEIAKKKMNLEKYFGQHLYNISHVQNICKPDPAIYLYAADKLEVDPEECLAVEDSAHGIKAAVNAGMYCLGINTSKNPEQIQESHELIEGFHEIDLTKLLSVQEKKNRRPS